MIRTRVGYAGGNKKAPSYHELGDHTEAVQLDYDPRKITYKHLLALFWDSHDPSSASYSRQYMNAIFYENEAQRAVAMASKADLELKTGGPVKTAIVPVRSFTLAEDYHQKYMLKSHRSLTREMENLYPQHVDFVNSTAVTRLNGYAGGYGTMQQWSSDMDQLGLSPAGKKEMASLIGR